MIDMSKWFQENGFLSEEGKRALIEVRDELENVLGQDEVREMSVQELQTLQCNLMKMVGDAMSQKIAYRQQISNEYAHLTDDQFYAYLQEKYGSLWQFMSLTPEELARIPPLSEEDIKKALEQGRKDWEAVSNHQGGFIPRGFYRGK